MSELGDLFKIVSEGKKEFEKTDPIAKAVKNTKQSVQSDLSVLFEELAELRGQLAVIESVPEPVINTVKEKSALKVLEEIVNPKPVKKQKVVKEEVIKEEIPAQPIIKTPAERQADSMADVAKYLNDKSFQQPNPDAPSTNVDDIRNKIKFLEQAIGRIAATGPGGGEVNLRYLDDVAKETIADGLVLKYDGPTKKFAFVNINANAIIQNTTYVTVEEYTVQESDYYIGVDYSGPTTIILPVSDLNGRGLVIKDETGNAETNPISVQGTVDNDVGGFVIQINNGAIQLIYRNGWRII